MDIFKKVIKATALFLVLAFCVAIIARVLFSQYTPSSVKRICYTDALESYCRENGTASFKTQKIRYYYDDNKKGSFFAENLIFEEDAGNLQITLKYNDSALSMVSDFYGVNDIAVGNDPADDTFTYRLVAVREVSDDGEYIGDVYGESASLYKSVWFYNYEKVVFDGVDFDGAIFMEIEIYLKDTSEAFGRIMIYENNEEYSEFSDYKPKRAEKLK